VSEPSDASDSGQRALVETEHLGVISDLSSAAKGFITVGVSTKRQNKIKDLVREVSASEKLRS
jgi:hypothetical protein